MQRQQDVHLTCSKGGKDVGERGGQLSALNVVAGRTKCVCTH